MGKKKIISTSSKGPCWCSDSLVEFAIQELQEKNWPFEVLTNRFSGFVCHRLARTILDLGFDRKSAKRKCFLSLFLSYSQSLFFNSVSPLPPLVCLYWLNMISQHTNWKRERREREEGYASKLFPLNYFIMTCLKLESWRKNWKNFNNKITEALFRIFNY